MQHTTTALRQPLSHGYAHITVAEAIRAWICSHPAGTLIETSVRRGCTLAGVGDRGWGAWTPTLRRMQRDGWIAVATAASGTLIEVLRSDLGGDQPADRGVAVLAEGTSDDSAPGCYSVAEEGDQPADRFEALEGGDQPADRPTRNKVLIHVYDQHQQRAGADVDQDKSEQEPDDLTPEIRQRINDLPLHAPEIWAAICRGTPGYTVEQFAEDVRTLLARGKGEEYALSVTIWARRAGRPIYGAAQVAQRAEQFCAQIAPDLQHSPESTQEQSYDDAGTTTTQPGGGSVAVRDGGEDCAGRSAAPGAGAPAGRVPDGGRIAPRAPNRSRDQAQRPPVLPPGFGRTLGAAAYTGA